MSINTQSNRFSNLYEKSISQYMAKLRDGSTRSVTPPQYTHFIWSPSEYRQFFSMPLERILAFQQQLKDQLGEHPNNVIDSLSNKNYEKAFETLGSDEDVDKLIDFAVAYLSTDETGPQAIEKYAPKNLNDVQMALYVEVGVFQEIYGREILSAMQYAIESEGMIIVSGREAFCKRQAKIELGLLGMNIGVETMVAIATAGTIGALEEAADIIGLIAIYLEYEACNHRTH